MASTAKIISIAVLAKNPSNAKMSVVDQAKTIAKDNVKACSQDLLHWRNTGVMPEGYVSQMESLLRNEYRRNASVMAESFIVEAALEAVAAGF